MQIEDSSLIGIIELESPATSDFDTLVYPGNNSPDKTTHHRPSRFRSPAPRWTRERHRGHEPATQDLSGEDTSVIALRFPRHDRRTSTVAADLSQLEEELHHELRRLRCRIDRLRPCGS